MFELVKKKVLVTGGHGFLGCHLVSRLRKRGVALVAPTSQECDLRVWSQTEELLARERPQAIFHLAARVGGIGANQANPGSFFYDSAIMGLQLIELARRYDVEKTVIVGTVCSYPKETPVPFSVDDLWNGYPEPTNAPYGLAKKMLLVQTQAYREQYGTNAIYVMPTNLYGPGDNFSEASSHVIPAMIRKFHEGRLRQQSEVTLWGDGTPTREFLHVEDAVEGLILSAERYEGPAPLNLGSGLEISIGDLATKIKALVGFPGDIVWDVDRPNGQARRCVDSSKLRDLGFEPSFSIDRGLRQTVEEFMKSVES